MALYCKLKGYWILFVMELTINEKGWVLQLITNYHPAVICLRKKTLLL